MNATEKQRQHIEAARKLLKPTPVRLRHVPNWLRLRMLKAFGCSNRDTAGWAVLNHATGGINPSWLDHWGSTVLPSGQRAFVSEPYNFGAETARAVQAFCEPAGLRWHVDANSEWYPGWTVRIEITEPTEGEG